MLDRCHGEKHSLSKSNTAPLSSFTAPCMGVGGQSWETLFTLSRLWLSDLGLVTGPGLPPSAVFSSIRKAVQLSTDALCFNFGNLDEYEEPFRVGRMGTVSLFSPDVCFFSIASGTIVKHVRAEDTAASMNPQDKVSTPLCPCSIPYSRTAVNDDKPEEKNIIVGGTKKDILSYQFFFRSPETIKSQVFMFAGSFCSHFHNIRFAASSQQRFLSSHLWDRTSGLMTALVLLSHNTWGLFSVAVVNAKLKVFISNFELTSRTDCNDCCKQNFLFVLGWNWRNCVKQNSHKEYELSQQVQAHGCLDNVEPHWKTEKMNWTRV